MSRVSGLSVCCLTHSCKVMRKGYVTYLTKASADTLCGVVAHDTQRIITEVKKPWLEKLKQLAKKQGITQEQLAPVLGVKTRGSVGHYLNGRREMTPEQLYALTQYLGTTVEEVMGTPESLDAYRLAIAIQTLPPDSRATLQKVADAFAKSSPWNGKLDRRTGK